MFSSIKHKLIFVLLILCCLKSKTIQKVTTMNKIFKHVACRNGLYAKTIQRLNVSDDLISWKESFESYKPPHFEAPVLRGKPWADPAIDEFQPKFNELDENVNRVSWTGSYEIVDGLPLNPFGRTGK
jgi:ADP-ribose pyrophosphatase